MLTRTRKRVTRRDILPGTTSMGMRKDIQDTTTNNPEQISVCLPMEPWLAYRIKDIDQDKEEGDQEGHAPRDHVHGNEE